MPSIWSEHPPGCDCRWCQPGRPALLARLDEALRAVEGQKAADEPEEPVRVISGLGRVIEPGPAARRQPHLPGSGSIFAVALPAEPPAPQDPLASIREVLLEPLGLVRSAAMPSYDDVPPGCCTRCHLGPELGRGLCIYCTLADEENARLAPPAAAVWMTTEPSSQRLAARVPAAVSKARAAVTAVLVTLGVLYLAWTVISLVSEVYAL